jgi:hypothetical protein
MVAGEIPGTGVSITFFFNVIVILGAILYIYFHQDTLSLFVVLVIITFLFYGFNRYWRNREGFLTRR